MALRMPQVSGSTSASLLSHLAYRQACHILARTVAKSVAYKDAVKFDESLLNNAIASIYNEWQRHLLQGT